MMNEGRRQEINRKASFKVFDRKNREFIRKLDEKPSIQQVKVRRLFDSVAQSKELQESGNLYSRNLQETLKGKLGILNSYNHM